MTTSHIEAIVGRCALPAIQPMAYASCYVYSPAGAGSVCERSRLLRDLLKSGDVSFMLKYAARVRQQTTDCPHLAGFFAADDVLVPVPGSAPLERRCCWVAAELAVALVNAGLGCAAWPGLRRVRAVPRSATAPPGERPSVGLHYDSFGVEDSPVPPGRIILIDDVVTKGRTLLAAATRIREAFPTVQIRAFALVRTLGAVSGLRHLLEPCKGQIRWREGDAYRCP